MFQIELVRGWAGSIIIDSVSATLLWLLVSLQPIVYSLAYMRYESALYLFLHVLDGVHRLGRMYAGKISLKVDLSDLR